MTRLSPLEEQLFQSWSKAHRIEDHNDPKNIFDYRKIYKDTNGQIHPPGMLNGMAQAANGAVGDAQQGGDQADPWAAQAEMHAATLDSNSKAKSDALKKEMNSENNKVKIHLKQLELSHKSAESEKDRAHKAQEAQMQHQLTMRQSQMEQQGQMQQAQMGFQHDAQQAQMGHQASMQEAQVGHAHSMEQAQEGQQHDLHKATMQEQMARSRPQPQPQQPQGGMPGQPQVAGHASTPQQMPGHEQSQARPAEGGSNLGKELLRRHLGR